MEIQKEYKMYCKNLLKRQRKYKPYFYCKASREEIILPCNENCSMAILKTNKPIKKVSNKIARTKMSVILFYNFEFSVLAQLGIKNIYAISETNKNIKKTPLH